MENKKIYGYLFLRFLKELGIYGTFCTSYTISRKAKLECFKNRDRINFSRFLNYCTPENYVDFAFIWTDSERPDIWAEVDTIWRTVHRKKLTINHSDYKVLISRFKSRYKLCL